MVTGLDKLKRRLIDELPKKTRAALEQAMLESAEGIVAGAKLRVPVDEGELKATIRHHGVKTGKDGGLYVAVTAGDETTIVPNAAGKRYQLARLVEFGTERSLKAGGKLSVPAEPFLLPAFRANKRKARSRMRRAIRDAILKG